MQQVMDWCCTQMSTHLALLQESVLSQKLQREDEIMLAIARLKRVRDTLKGTVECNDVGQEEAEGWTLLSSEPSSSLVEDISWGGQPGEGEGGQEEAFQGPGAQPQAHKYSCRWDGTTELISSSL
ncbi:hypothetical protein MRX96_002562 [Rhipicephalus microplus]